MKKAPNGFKAGSARGFTLLELMITVAVLAIMVGIGVPSYQDLMRRNRLAAQTNQLIGVLAFARSEAVKRGVRVTICPANDAVNQDACSDDGNWAANGLIVFTDNLGAIGELDLDEDGEPEDNDAILQRLPPAATQRIRIGNARVLMSYMQNGNLDLPAGEDSQFIVAPEDCKDPDGARLVQVIAAGRASARPTACPADGDVPDAPEAG